MNRFFRRSILTASVTASLFAGRRACTGRPVEKQGDRDLEANERACRWDVQEVHGATRLRSGQAGRRQRQADSIDTASYDLGDESYNQQVRGKDWFDTAQFPNATFVSSAIAPAGGNQFKVSGKLTIKGKSENVTVPVTVTQQGATQTFDGALPIKRSQFDIGSGEWKDTSVVADEVVIKFHLVDARNK